MSSSLKYLKMPYKTPEDLRDAYGESSILIIGSGTSTNNLIKYKDQIKDHFDVVIGVNLTCLDFRDVMDYHMIMEGHPENMIKKILEDDSYRKDLVRVLNFGNIKFFPKGTPAIKVRRVFACNGKPNMKQYHHGKTEGLLDDQNRIRHKKKIANYGTVIMQAFHFACILGGKDIYFIGADLMFKGEYDHYYEDHIYRSPKERTLHNRPVVIDHHGRWATTTHVFYRSAKWLDSIIKNYCGPNNITVYDFSDGLLTAPIKLDIEDFFK